MYYSTDLLKTKTNAKREIERTISELVKSHRCQTETYFDFFASGPKDLERKKAVRSKY